MSQPAPDPRTSHHPGLPLGPAPEAPARIRTICLLSMLAIFVGHTIPASLQVIKEKADFCYFYSAGNFMLEHGTFDPGWEQLPDGEVRERGSIEWYLPFVTQFFAVVAAIGRVGELVGLPAYQTAGILWLYGNLVAAFATFRLIGRRMLDLPPRDWPVTTLLPIIITLFFWHWEFRLNQVDTLTLLMLVWSFLSWRDGHQARAGFWLGFAVLLKVTPAVMVLWLILKRAWRTVIVAGVVIVLGGPVGSAIALGPQYAASAYANWFHVAARGSSQMALVCEQREMDWRNQGLGATLSRWLHETSYATRFENDPRIKRFDEPGYLNVANLPTEVIGGIATGVLALGLLGLIVYCRRPARGLSEWRLRAEWGLVLVFMLCAMPVLRRYHLIMLTPVIALLFAGIHHLTLRHPWSKIAACAVLANFAAQWAILPRVLADAPYLVEAAGAMWFTTAAFAIPLVLLGRIAEKAECRMPNAEGQGQRPNADGPMPECPAPSAESRDG